MFHPSWSMTILSAICLQSMSATVHALEFERKKKGAPSSAASRPTQQKNLSSSQTPRKPQTGQPINSRHVTPSAPISAAARSTPPISVAAKPAQPISARLSAEEKEKEREKLRRSESGDEKDRGSGKTGEEEYSDSDSDSML